MDYIGIDIGSTATKVVVRGGHLLRFVLPTGWDCREAAHIAQVRLAAAGIRVGDRMSAVVATGYGREAVDYADRRVTEISCHAAGASEEAPDAIVLDIGGQDTKAILLKNGSVADFLMNDKCAAGTGKFVEIMAARLGCGIDGLFEMAERGMPLPISSTCTVFAETEVINYIGTGKPREDIAAGVVDSVASKAAALAAKLPAAETVLLTGGLSHLAYFANRLGEKLGRPVRPVSDGRFAGATGAALLAEKMVRKG